MKTDQLALFLGLFISLSLFACVENNPSDVNEDDISSSSVMVNDYSSSSDIFSCSSSQNITEHSSSSQVKLPCDFLASDSVWSYSVNTSNGSDEGTIVVTYNIHDKDLVRIEKAFVSGSASSFVCRLMNGSENESDFFGDSTYVKKSICNGSEMISTSTIILDHYFENTSVEDLYSSVLNSCKIANKFIPVPSISSAKMETTCDFKVEDNLWEYSFGDSSSYRIERFIFDGEDVTNLSYIIEAMDYAECLAITPSSQSLRYCDEMGLLEKASSGMTITETERELFFKSIQKDCLENVSVEE